LSRATSRDRGLQPPSPPGSYAYVRHLAVGCIIRSATEHTERNDPTIIQCVDPTGMLCNQTCFMKLASHQHHRTDAATVSSWWFGSIVYVLCRTICLLLKSMNAVYNIYTSIGFFALCVYLLILCRLWLMIMYGRYTVYYEEQLTEYW